MRLPRLTTRRLMALVFITGATIGGVIEIDRALKRRAAYLGMAYIAENVRKNALWLASLYAEQAAAIRRWAAEGFRGNRPRALDWRNATLVGYTFDANQVESLRRDPEIALTLASRLEREGERCRQVSLARGRLRQSCERRASFPRIFFSPDPEPDPALDGFLLDRGR